jgi:hypothetical protein
MAADGSVDPKEALEIAQDAAMALQSRLRFIRAAWAVDGAELDAAAIRGYCAGLPQARKVSFDFAALAGVFSPAMSRGLLNLVLIGIESLPRGGKVRLAGDLAGGVVMTIAGAHAAWPAGFAALLSDEQGAWLALRDSRSLQAPLTMLILQQNQLKLRFLMAAGEPAAPLPVVLTHG